MCVFCVCVLLFFRNNSFASTNKVSNSLDQDQDTSRHRVKCPYLLIFLIKLFEIVLSECQTVMDPDLARRA